jgi:hypothetical protein
MKTKALLSLGSIIVGSIALNLMPVQPAQAVNLVSNGTFTGATVNGGTSPGYTNGAVTTSAYLGDTNVSLPGWSFSINAQNPSNGQQGYNFLVKYGTQGHSNLADQNKCAAPYSTNGSSCYGVGALTGSVPILDPVTGGTSGWFIAADAFFNHGAINTSVSGLTLGDIYTVSFYQATGQQTSQNSNFTDYFDVSFGGTTQQSATMSYTAGSNVTPWTLQSLDFTATSVTQTLSFLAQSPNDVPPFALLSNVSVAPKSLNTKIPEPETYIGTLIGFGFLGAFVTSRLTKKKLDEVD